MLQKALEIENISKICHVPIATVLRWIQSHGLKTINVPGSAPKVGRAELIEFLKSMHIPVPRELVLLDSLRIIIVEHDEELKKWIFDELNDLLPNAKVSASNYAFEAGFLTNEMNPHILIIDFDMPGTYSFSICKMLKNNSRFKFIKIIGIGDKELEKKKKELIESGADEFFPKPLLMKPFKDTIVFMVNELV